MTSGADVLIHGLAQLGFRQLFGMPGSHSTAIYDALQREGSIRSTLIRNEQAGAYAADGYARVTGKPGLICTTAGPGATNALTGIAECWADSVPVLLIAGQVNSDRMHQECGAYHEIDLESIFRPVTKWCGTVRNLDDLPSMLGQAFDAMTQGRPRPAALFLPQDLMKAPAQLSPIPRSEFSPRLPSPKVITEAAELLGQSRRPVVLAGGGALWAGAEQEVKTLAQRLNAPVITSLNGKGLLDEYDPLSLGHARSVRSREVLAQADALIAVGCRFTEVMTGWHTLPIPRNLIQIDLDPDQIGMNYPVAVGIEADAKQALLALIKQVPEGSREEWVACWELARELKPPRPEWLIDTLRACLPDHTPVFTDACEMGYRLQTDWVSRGPRRFFYPSNYITLGWGLPAALGASVTLESGHVVSVSGDGGFLMAAQELATLSRYQLPLIAIIHNDNAYGAIKNIQKRDHEARFLDVDLNNPDLIALGASFGIPSVRASDADELTAELHSALNRRGPSLIEIPDHWRLIRQ